MSAMLIANTLLRWGGSYVGVIAGKYPAVVSAPGRGSVPTDGRGNRKDLLLRSDCDSFAMFN